MTLRNFAEVLKLMVVESRRRKFKFNLFPLFFGFLDKLLIYVFSER